MFLLRGSTRIEYFTPLREHMQIKLWKTCTVNIPNIKINYFTLIL